MNTAPKRRDLYARLDTLGVEWLFDRIVAGESLRAIARGLNASATAVLKWIDRSPERMRQYQLARQAQADTLVDELLDLADQPLPVGPDGRIDPAAVNQLRLRIDARKWVASKFRPSTYGDRVDVSTTVSSPDLTPEQAMTKLKNFLAEHGLQIVPDDQHRRALRDPPPSSDLERAA